MQHPAPTDQVLDNLKLYCKDENKIGEGAFGQVYRGRFNDQDVAIKRIDSQNVSYTSEDVLHVQLLGHHNVIKCFDASHMDASHR